MGTINAGAGRTLDHTVNGATLTKSKHGRGIHLYIHHDVGGVWNSNAQKPAGRWHGLVRYTLSLDALRRATRHAKAELEGGESQGDDGDIGSCPKGLRPSPSACWVPPSDARLSEGIPVGFYGAVNAAASIALRADLPHIDTDQWLHNETKGLVVVPLGGTIDAVAKEMNCNPVTVSYMYDEEIPQQRQTQIFFIDGGITHTVTCAVKPVINLESKIQVTHNGEPQLVCDIAVSSTPPVQLPAPAQPSSQSASYKSNECIADEMRYGRWIRQRSGAEHSLSCRSYRWENRTCGPPADARTFCYHSRASRWNFLLSRWHFLLIKPCHFLSAISSSCFAVQEGMRIIPHKLEIPH